MEHVVCVTHVVLLAILFRNVYARDFYSAGTENFNDKK